MALCTKRSLSLVSVLAVLLLCSLYYYDTTDFFNKHKMYGSHGISKLYPKIREETREPLPNKTTQTASTTSIFQSFEDNSEVTSSARFLRDFADPSNHALLSPDAAVSSPTTSSKAQQSSKSLSKSGMLIPQKKSLFTTVPSIKQGPIQNLFFLKTHKTGSSTLQNILLRYANNHNRTVGLPLRGVVFPSYFKANKMTASDLQKVPDGKKINMIMHHLIPDYDIIRSLLPRDAYYISILRDPATQFKSEFTYFRQHTAAFRRARTFEDFVNNITKYYRGEKDGKFWWFSKNPMTFDLGFDNRRDDAEYLNATLKNMNKIFHLVFIVEYFDMGLILLKEALRWKMEDIVYLSNNLQNGTSTPLDVAVENKVYDWNKADFSLYDYFNKTFWRKVEEFGKDRMEADLTRLNIMKQNLANACVENQMVDNSKVKDAKFKLFYNPGVRLLQYKLKKGQENNETCIGMILPEVQWWKKMSKLQEDG